MSNPSTPGEEAERVWRMMEKIGFCMLVTRDGQELRSRPMAAYVRPEENRIWFLTDADSAKDEEVAAHPQVNLAFADPSAQTYASVTGRARVSNDREKIRQLFGTPARAWWDDAEDPDIRVLEISPVDAQYWDSPGKLRAYARMALAALSEVRPAMGENEKVDLSGHR